MAVITQNDGMSEEAMHQIMQRSIAITVEEMIDKKFDREFGLACLNTALADGSRCRRVIAAKCLSLTRPHDAVIVHLHSVVAKNSQRLIPAEIKAILVEFVQTCAAKRGRAQKQLTEQHKAILLALSEQINES
eukprot:c12302_g1_i1.p1 GENE.c12302_g1_i1~~c12302_g1_i1.p1  ORF type:complete len:133 (-),score=23.41 c12302_g1_i1:15-413(-)